MLEAKSYTKGEWFYNGYCIENGSHVLWVEEEDGTWTGRNGQNILRYLNHHTNPHAEFNGFDLYAVKNINEGEELTIDYGEEPNPDDCE